LFSSYPGGLYRDKTATENPKEKKNEKKIIRIWLERKLLACKNWPIGKLSETGCEFARGGKNLNSHE